MTGSAQRSKKLKDAHSAAEAEVKRFKEEREEKFKQYKAQVNLARCNRNCGLHVPRFLGSESCVFTQVLSGTGDHAVDLSRRTQIEIDELNSSLASRKQPVIDMLLAAVTKVE